MIKENAPIGNTMAKLHDGVNNQNLLTEKATRSITENAGEVVEYSAVPKLLPAQTENESMNRTHRVGEDIFIAPKTPEPIEIYSAQTVHRTKRMREVEKQHGLPGETIRDILQRLYFGNKIDPNPLTITDIATLFGCNRHTIKKWMKLLNIPTRTKKEAAEFIHSPLYKNEHLVARAHSEQANQKRRETLKQRWAALSLEKRKEILHKGHQKRLARYERERQELLGINGQATLQSLIDQGLSYKEIAEKLGRSEGSVKSLLKNYSLKTLGNLGKGKRSASQEDIVDQAREAGILDIPENLEVLTQRGCRILKARFPINGKYPVPLRELADEYGVTRQAIRKIQSKVIRMLQQFL